MAYYLGFDSEDEEPTFFDTMEELSDDELQSLGLYKILGYRFLSKLTGHTELALQQSLKATLVSPDNKVYFDIETYFNNGQCHDFKLRVNKLFKIRRFEDINCFLSEGTIPKLLWHGTKDENITSILTLGFTRPIPSNQMFGNGIYFADRVSKSAQYSMDRPESGTKGHLFLCSVSLGNIYSSYTSHQNQISPPSGYDSVLGIGKLIPNEDEQRLFQDAIIPCGKTVNRSKANEGLLQFNEYIVYDIDRIAIKFLVEFEVI